MKTVLKIEELAMTGVALYALSFHSLEINVWIWVLLFFSPDISMLGYLINPKFGAFSYNFFHHKAISLLLVATGYFFKVEPLVSAGLLLFAHSSFDRIWGYGLKYATGFKDTHLGSLEKKPLQASLR